MRRAGRNDSNPLASVELAIFALAPGGLEVLLARRAGEPFAGRWALPGGAIRAEEDVDLDAAARRLLSEQTGLATPYLEQLQTFGDAARDPRGWSVSIAYFALISADEARPGERVDRADAAWVPVAGNGVAVPVAFDHARILRSALGRLRGKVEYSTLPVHLLPSAFTLTELQSVYERILGRRLDKSAFRKRVAEADFVEPIPGKLRRASNRPAQLYRPKRGRATVLFDRTI